MFLVLYTKAPVKIFSSLKLVITLKLMLNDDLVVTAALTKTLKLIVTLSLSRSGLKSVFELNSVQASAPYTWYSYLVATAAPLVSALIFIVTGSVVPSLNLVNVSLNVISLTAFLKPFSSIISYLSFVNDGAEYDIFFLFIPFLFAILAPYFKLFKINF